MKKLENRLAFITGAADGNGLGISRVLARHGAHVILTDINEKVFISAKDIMQDGLIATAYLMDVTIYEDVSVVVNKVIEKYGKIDILVNNAGVCNLVGFLDMDNSTRDKMFKVNIEGPWNCSKAIIPHMLKNNYGKIVNISSVTGPMVVDFGDSAYGITKSALLAFTKSLALEYSKKNINVNAICPGYISTPMVEMGAKETNPNDPQSVINKIIDGIPMGRMGNACEIGDLVAFLASDESKYITGTQIVIDGGSTLPETFGAMGVG